ncbi:MAG TPA: hypothetical protein VNH44_06905 [Micropepsaceae bacterium]|nr:hypothetical protein [Micropepsaceae bacterium]
MGRAVKAGLVYFAIVFVAGFALGAVRILYVVPHLGATGAVLIELPVMLVISWIACGVVVRRFAIPQHMGHRLTMGTVAFVLLMLAELALARVAFGLSPEQFVNAFATPNGAIGLVGQIAFALFPLMHV